MSLRHAAYSAGRWTTASLLVRASLQFGQTILLAHLLAPADFGLMAVASAAYVIATMFVDMGLSNALIHFQRLTPSALSTLYWLNLLAAIFIALIFAALAWPLAMMYQQPRLIPIILLMSLAMPINAVGQQFRVLAEKELRFTTLSLIEVTAATCGIAASVFVALLDGGVFALVAAILVSGAVSSAFAWMFLSPGQRPRLQFNVDEVKPYLGYGLFRLGDTLFNNLHSQADILVGGTMTGSTAMGFYTMPREITLKLANTVINPMVTRVGLPVMAKVQGDKAALKSIYLQTLRVTSSINFPLYAALVVWAPEVISFLLGPQWQASVPSMRTLAIWGLFRSTSNPLGSLVYAAGYVKQAFWFNFSMLLITPAFLYVGARLGGTHGLAVTLICIQLLVFYPLFRLFVQKTCHARFGEYLGALAPPLIVTIISVGFGYFVPHYFLLDSWLYPIVGGAIASILYCLISYVFNRSWMSAIGELISPALNPIRAVAKS